VGGEVFDTASLLDVCPSLGAGLSEEERFEARPELRVPTVALRRGDWDDDLSEPGGFGVLLLEGALLRHIAAGRRQSIEVLIAGDLVRPWQKDPASFVDSSFSVLKESRVAVLEEDFIQRACRWPALIDALFERTTRRARSNATQATINSSTGIYLRVLFSFWHLAERCGVETESGIVVPLPLTHQLVSELVGAQRSSVSAALSRLAAAGALRRTEENGWILHPSSANLLPVTRRRVLA